VLRLEPNFTLRQHLTGLLIYDELVIYVKLIIYKGSRHKIKKSSLKLDVLLMQLDIK